MDASKSWFSLAARVALTGPSGPFDLDVEFSVAPGTLVALVGPSGAGKTTLLRVMAGLMRPGTGRIRVSEQVWCDTSARIDVPTRRRSIGFVFQDYALFPNMTVRRNVEYAIGSPPRPEDVQRLLQLVALEGLAEAYPARLSGGQKQRLALIRALARRPSLLILDEPLSALDPSMRRQLQAELKQLHRSFGTTTFLVSHDISEILRLADRVIRLDHGRIVFDGDPPSAFGVSSLDGFQAVAEHVSGPDDAGIAVIHHDGRLYRLRYRGRPGDLAPGDTVMLNFDEAAPARPA